MKENKHILLKILLVILIIFTLSLAVLVLYNKGFFDDRNKVNAVNETGNVINSNETEKIKEMFSQILTSDNNSTYQIETTATNKQLICSTKVLIFNNKEILNYTNDEKSLINQIIIYQDLIMIYYQNDSNNQIDIYDFNGKLIKEITSVTVNNNYYKIGQIEATNLFNVENNEIILNVTKKDAVTNKYFISDIKQIDLCTEAEANNITDESFAVVKVKFKYTGNYQFGDYEQIEVISTVKDIKSCS